MNAVSKAAAMMGSVGGKRRAAKLSPRRRSEIARMGYQAGIARRLAVRKSNAKATK